MKVVLAVANPAGLEAYRPGERPLPPVDVASEVGRARRALAGIDAVGVVELSENQPLRPTLDNLLAELRKGCDLLYLVGHGASMDESRLWLENDAGGVAVVAGSQLLGCFRELAVLPRLVVLASCQSASSGSDARAADGGALVALGPGLVEGGVLAVLAMQGDVFMDTVAAFMPTFFSELLRTGVIDQAAAIARTAARNAGRPDWWSPVLFHRLRDGRLWGQPARDIRTDAPDDLAGELRKYLNGVAERAAELSRLFPERLRKPSAGGTPFDRLRQQVRVLQDRTALQRPLAAERERMRARGLDPDALAYTPGRGRVDREADEDRREAERAAAPRVWDEQAAGEFRRAVILSDPGFGKTWLLRHEARRVARRALACLADNQADPATVEVPIYCRLFDLVGSDVPLEDALIAAATSGRSEGFRKWLRGRLETGHCVVLLDAWDEVQERRAQLRTRIDAFATAFPLPRLLLTSRIVYYGGSPVPNAKELELLPFGPAESEAFVGVWFGNAAKARPFLGHLRESPAVRGLARIPLMLLLLCRSFEQSEKTLPARRVELYERCLRGLLGEWQEEKSSDEINELTIDTQVEVLGEVAAALFQDGFEQFTETVLSQRLVECNERNPTLRLSRTDLDGLLGNVKDSGVLIRSGEAKESPWLFLHRTFQEYLTARALAQRAKLKDWKTIAPLIDRKCWLPEWSEVVALLAGELADPEALLALLSDEKKDDRFRHRLALAAHCLPELDPSALPHCAGLIDRITEGLVLLWWRMGSNGAEAAVRHAERAFPSLKRTGRVQARLVLDWFLERMRTPVRRGRHAGLRLVLDWFLERMRGENACLAMQGIAGFGSLAATPEILASLLALLRDTDREVGLNAAKAVGSLCAAAATPEFLASLLALLRDTDWVKAALAVGSLGAAAATPEFLASLLALLRDTDREVGLKAALAVGSLGAAAATPEFLASLLALLRDTDRYVRLIAALAVGRLGAAAATPEILAGLLALLRDTHRDVRANAANAVGRLGAAAATPEILAGLPALLLDTEWNVRSDAAKAVGSLGAAAATPEILASLLALLRDHREVGSDAAKAVGSLGAAAATPEILAGLLALLCDTDRYVRLNAALAVGSLGAAAATPEILAGLPALLLDTEWNVRSDAAKAVGSLGAAAATPEILASLLALLRDTHREVGSDAAKAVGSLGAAAATPEILAGLLALLCDTHRYVRLNAALAVGSLGAAAATPEILASLLALLGGRAGLSTFLVHLLRDGLLRDTNWYVRANAAKAVGSLGAAAATPKILAGLLALLRDADLGVRMEAASTLEGLFSKGLRIIGDSREFQLQWVNDLAQEQGP